MIIKVINYLIKNVYIKFHKFTHEKALISMLSKIYKGNLLYNKIPENINIPEHKDYWKRLSRTFSMMWYKTYASATQNVDVQFVPDTIFYSYIEPVLNNFKVYKAYADKNFFDKYYGKGISPRTILRMMDGVFYDENYNLLQINENKIFKILDNNDKFVIKPSLDTGGGKGFYLFNNKNNNFYDQEGNILNWDRLRFSFGSNFIIQEYVVQHNFFSKLNESSLNTMRVMTYRSVKTNKAHIIQVALKIGDKGNITDNLNNKTNIAATEQGQGVICGINKKGLLNKIAFNKNLNSVECIPCTNMKFSELDPIPSYDKMIGVAIKIAEKTPYFRLLSFDMCISKSGKPVIIEMNNCDVGLTPIQMLNGPLFMEFTDEIVEFCINNKPKNYKLKIIPNL